MKQAGTPGEVDLFTFSCWDHAAPISKDHPFRRELLPYRPRLAGNVLHTYKPMKSHISLSNTYRAVIHEIFTSTRVH